MHHDSANKRKRDGQDIAPTEVGREDEAEAPPEPILADMKTILNQYVFQMEQIQNEINLQRRQTASTKTDIDSLKSKNNYLEAMASKMILQRRFNTPMQHKMVGIKNKCQFLERRCSSLERSMQLMVKIKSGNIWRLTSLTATRLNMGLMKITLEQ